MLDFVFLSMGLLIAGIIFFFYILIHVIGLILLSTLSSNLYLYSFQQLTWKVHEPSFSYALSLAFYRVAFTLYHSSFLLFYMWYTLFEEFFGSITGKILEHLTFLSIFNDWNDDRLFIYKSVLKYVIYVLLIMRYIFSSCAPPFS